MRKTCASSNTAGTVALRLRAEGRSVPKGFSRIMRERAARPVRRRVSTIPGAASGGTDT